jgi:hypothetical protein
MCSFMTIPSEKVVALGLQGDSEVGGLEKGCPGDADER